MEVAEAASLFSSSMGVGEGKKKGFMIEKESNK